MSKKPKAPKLNSKTKLLSFDLEANGLHGQAFAIGAVVMDGEGKVHDQFSARIPIEGTIDDWVNNNVLPVITDMQLTHKTYQEMREAFWQWYLKAEPQSDYVLVNNGYPVEYRFLLDCQEASLDERYWQHPFPILDLSSILLASGHRSQKIQEGHLPHNPVHDAKLAITAAFEALRKTSQIS